jgi:hypothetical protein
MFLTPSQARTALAKLVVCIGLLFSVQSAFACLCEGGSSKKAFNRARKKADVIFVGRAVDVHNGITHAEFRGWRITLKVERYWKGQPTQEVVVFTGPGDCAAYFQVGDEYLVLAYVSEGKEHLYTDVCMRTGLVRYSANDLKWLGKAKRVS